MFGILKKRTIQSLKIKSILRGSEENVRKKVRIVVIDDDPMRNIFQSLKSWGYDSASFLPIITDVRDVEQADIVVIDIKDVGAKLEEFSKNKREGLAVVDIIKAQYPMKKVLVYSAAMAEYENDVTVRKVADGYFHRDDEPVTICKKLNKAISEMFDPVCIWSVIRARLEKASISQKDIEIAESQYVKLVESKRDLTAENLTGKTWRKLLPLVEDVLTVVKICCALAV